MSSLHFATVTEAQNRVQAPTDLMANLGGERERFAELSVKVEHYPPILLVTKACTLLKQCHLHNHGRERIDRDSPEH